MTNTFFIVSMLAYLSGSVPFAKIIGNLNGIDIQKKGSGNIGFANTYRVLGPKPALFVLLGDTLKGFIPAFLAMHLSYSTFEIITVGILAIIGHIFPLWLKGKGGKGIATSLGVLISLSPIIALTAVCIWLIVLTKTKIFSLASLTAAWITVFITPFFTDTKAYFFYILLVVILGTFLHRKNIGRLITGEEPRSWKW